MKHELPKYHVILEFFFFFLSHLFHHTKQKQSKGFHPLKETRRIIYLNEKKKKKHFSRFFSKTRWLKIVTPNSSYRTVLLLKRKTKLTALSGSPEWGWAWSLGPLGYTRYQIEPRVRLDWRRGRGWSLNTTKYSCIPLSHDRHCLAVLVN